MGGNTITCDNGIEQMLRGFASAATLYTMLEGLNAQFTALRAEFAELHDAGITVKSKPSRWLKLKEAADLLNTSPKTVRRYIERGLLTRSAASRHILIPREDVEGLRNKVVV